MLFLHRIDRAEARKAGGGKYDPVFHKVPGPDGDVMYIKDVPDYIPAEKAKALQDLRRMSYHLDLGLFKFMGIRFGWSFVIGLIPVIGDFADLFLGAIQIYICATNGARFWTVVKMILHHLFDFVLGLIPFLGDFADAWFKAFTINTYRFAWDLEREYNKSHPNKDLPAARLVPLEESTQIEGNIFSNIAGMAHWVGDQVARPFKKGRQDEKSTASEYSEKQPPPAAYYLPQSGAGLHPGNTNVGPNPRAPPVPAPIPQAYRQMGAPRDTSCPSRPNQRSSLDEMNMPQVGQYWSPLDPSNRGPYGP